jgi:ribosomal-protein-alanine N-acetyltransferase
MMLDTCRLTSAMSAVAGALHAASGFHETWDAGAFAELIAMPGAGGCLALEGETPIGLILWRIAADEAEILTICTAPARRRQGAGGYLLDTAITITAAAGARRLLLEVAVDNMAAIALYRAFGFTELGRRRGYYQNAEGPVDALTLRKNRSSRARACTRNLETGCGEMYGGAHS